MNGNLIFIFLIRCKYYKKIIICGNISLAIALWADLFIAYIALNPTRQFYPEDLANFADTMIFFFIAALIIRWFGQIVALPQWTWLLLLLRSFFIDNHNWWYLLSSSSFPPTSLALFCYSKSMSVSFIETFAFSREIVLWRFLTVSLRFNG